MRVERSETVSTVAVVPRSQPAAEPFRAITMSDPKLVAYVSDERYVALPDVILEFEGAAGSFEARSRATGGFTV